MPGDHLILRWAQFLAQLHRLRHVNPGRASRNDYRRGELVALIHNWTATYICASQNDAERVGKAVDDLAAAYVDAQLALTGADDGSDTSVHDAWREASSLAVGWTDLVAEVVDGQPPWPRRRGHTSP